MRYATEITKTPRGTICCGNDPKVVYFNPYNEVVQCHSCGHVYEPKPSVAETESDELDPTVNTRRRGDASLLQRLIDELEHAVAQGYQPNLLDIAEARQALSAAAPSVLDAIRIVENCEYENVAVDVILRRLKALSSCVSVSDSARRAAEWRDEGGHVWEIRPNVDCVECPHCCFTFAAVHTDGYGNAYSCPNCKGCPDAAAPADNDAESSSPICVCPITPSERCPIHAALVAKEDR